MNFSFRQSSPVSLRAVRRHRRDRDHRRVRLPAAPERDEGSHSRVHQRLEADASIRNSELHNKNRFQVSQKVKEKQFF